jgi:protein-tyrosine phosphatase
MFDILMVCTGNICRSPMAAGLLKHMLPPYLRARVRVSSAGTHALHGHQAAPPAVAAMARRGIDIRGHRARQVSREMLTGADLTLAMESEQVQLLGKMVFWKRSPIRLLSAFDPGNDSRHPPEIEDPYGHPLEVYQQCLTLLHPCIEGVIHWLENHADFKTTNHHDA